MTDTEEGKPRFVRRSPLKPTLKLCPNCLEPLQKGSKLGGFMVPQDYYCSGCGYSGILYLEKPIPRGDKG
ncbi:MAG: hypothetical protein LYZ66_04455 [Nitrososphaerales archaeon]|nr:hypothetical protein [Nitrososphaerales archaeon]